MIVAAAPTLAAASGPRSIVTLSTLTAHTSGERLPLTRTSQLFISARRMPSAYPGLRLSSLRLSGVVGGVRPGQHVSVRPVASGIIGAGRSWTVEAA
jgi:hypothetical protein